MSQRTVPLSLAAASQPAVPQGEPKTVCWFKHGPYEDGELLTCVFEDPQDEDNYSALIFKDESIRDYTAPAPQAALGAKGGK